MKKKSSPAGQRKKTARKLFKKSSPDVFADEREAALAEAEQLHRENIAHVQRVFQQREATLKTALTSYKPKKSERGKIVFVGLRGGKVKKAAQKGFAIYVNRKGKKSAIRQKSRRTGKIEKFPIPRRLINVDVSRATSQTAKRKFLMTRLNPRARGAMRNLHRRKITGEGTRFFGEEKTARFFATGGAVSGSIKNLARELKAARDSVRSARGKIQGCEFMVTLGFAFQDKSGGHHWHEVSDKFSRQFGQPALPGELYHFFGMRIYREIARWLAQNGFVMAGSAGNVERRGENDGKAREDWTKDGESWTGRYKENIELTAIEYRFDLLEKFEI